jgi:glyceraldehyde 3-phosphate dehydrogenase
MTKIAINGFGRIGRPALKVILDKHPNLEIVAVNDLTDTKTLAHLFKYDSNYGIYEKDVDYDNEHIIIDGRKIKVFAQKDPELLPWKDLKVDVVLECTGFFRDSKGAGKHLKAGAKKVIISAPAKSEEITTFVLGVNEEKYNSKKDDIISNASCTTNCLAPVVKVLNDNLGIEKGVMTTIHSYTNDQKILDLPHKDLRRGRAAAMSIIPTTTGATKAVIQTIPELEGKLDGMAMRVPTPVVSIVDFVATVKKSTNKDKVNNLFKEAAENNLKNILAVSEKELVSMDFKMNKFSSIVDLPLTMVNENLVKVCAWYDNEWGYACRLVEMAKYISEK